MRKHKGFFITIEGTAEGIGKTTQAQHLYENLKKAGYDVILTKHPGGTELGRKLREILLTPRPKEQELSKATELFLFYADYAQNYKETIKPALKARKIVVCDRFLDTTLAYQGSGRGWKTAFLLRLHHAATGSLLPDLTFVLDGTPHRGKPNDDRFEKLGSDFFRRVRSGMLHFAKKSDRYVVMNANVDETELAQAIFNIVKDRLPNPLR